MAYLIHNVLPNPPRKIACIGHDESVQQCVNQMAVLNIGALMVVDEHQRLMGLVSERDVLRGCIQKGLDPKKTNVSAIVCSDVAVLSPHDTVEKAMQVITDTKRRHILIQEHNEFIAILSIGDLLCHLLEDKARVIAHLEHYINS